MKKSILIALLFVGFIGLCNAQNKIKQYEYWFDDNFAGKTTVNAVESTEIQINTSVSTAALPTGLHSIHFRFKDTKGLWSAPVNQFFIKIPSNANQHHQISRYEYWFDNNYSQKNTQSVTAQDSVAISTSLQTNTLPAGLHSIHIRFCDNTGLWSSAINQFFIKIPSNANQHHQISKYEYWFDNNYSQKNTQSVTAQDSVAISTSLQTNTLPAGLHSIHIRFCDNTGLWSSAINQFFIKPVFADTSNKIIAYRYWFDTLYTNQVTINVNPANPLQLNNVIIPVTAVQKVTPNDYVFNPDPVNGVKITYLTPTLLRMQFKDTKGLWGSSLVDTVKYRYTLPVICDTLLSNVTKTKNNPIKDSLHFFTFNALQGDSLIFKTNKALIIDIFDTYGLKIKTITASESINGKGIRANLDGPYFAIVHGFSTPSGTYTITYTHIAKYAILDYTPHKVGNNGMVLMSFIGNGFTPSTTVTLTKGTTIIQPDTIVSNELSSLRANFNFDSIALGFYNIEFDFGDTTIVIPNGLEVEGNIPIQLSVSVLGPTAFRVGVPTTYTIQVENHGNTTAYGVPLGIVIKYFAENTISNLNLNGGIKKPIKPNINYSLLTQGERDTLSMYYDNFKDVNYFLKIYDSTKNVYALSNDFYITALSPNSVYSMSITITANSEIQLFVSVPKEISIDSNVSNTFNINNLNVQCCTYKTINCILSIVDIFNNLPIDINCIYKGVLNQIGFSYTLRCDMENDIKKDMATISTSFYNSVISVALSCLPLGEVRKFFKILDKISATLSAGMACYDATKYFMAGNCSQPTNNDSIRPTPVNSWDPNDKIGYRSPSGSLSFNAAKTNFTYIINFENKDSATAPAQEVWIIDTINKNLLDIKSFKAGYIKIGNRIVQAPYNAQNHTWEVDMRPAMNLRTRVQLTLDTLNGIAHWYFKSIDPLTSNLPIDPFSGFLPPNDSTGSGQGSVAFTINLKDSLSDGTNIHNRATILFDNNPPIPTPTWTNTMDNTKPHSFIEPLAPHQMSDTINLNWHGTDSGSGIYNYAIYVSENGNNSYLWKTTHDTSAIFIGGVDTTYRFYSIATDSAGNIENTPLNFDAITTICHIPVKATLAVGMDTVCANTNIVYTSNSDFANKYIWNIYPSAAGFTNDTTSSANIHWNKRYSGLAHIYVKGTNECGIGDYSDTLTITVNPLPDTAQQITGFASVCQGQNSVLYNIPSIANATFYTWTLPNGVTGNSIADSIMLNYGNTAVSGQISVKGINACGNGDSSTLAITVNPLPDAAQQITGLASVCQGQSSVVYKVPSIANATSYTWTLPSGATGTSSVDSIVANYGTSAVSGNITVKGNNTCGSGAVSTKAIIVNPLPASTGTITGLATVCQGQNSVVYKVPTIANATSYTWTLPSGASGISTIDSINVSFGTSATSGNMTVKGNNACGNGDSSTLAITVNPLPDAAQQITGLASVCQGQSNVTYKVPIIANASFYSWTLPNGTTVTNSIDSIIVNFGTSAISGILKVKGNNACGNGDSSTLAITVNPLPQTPVITQNGDSLLSDVIIGNQWYSFTNGIINNATSAFYLPQQIGDYFTIVTLNGCSSDTSNILHFDNTGINYLIGSDCKIIVSPNPFSVNTTISYTLTENKNIRLSISDITGREIEILNEGYQAKGEYKYVFTPKSTANGIYFYKLQIDNKYVSGKLIYAK